MKENIYFFIAATALASLVIVPALLIQPNEPVGADPILEVSLTDKIETMKTEQGYTQIMKGEGDKAGLPANVWVNVYSGPKGKGYQTVTEYLDRIEYVGHGPHADEFTRTEMKPIIGVSTSS